jgi:beta-1,4-N-acetylglucosaminyltransferase
MDFSRIFITVGTTEFTELINRIDICDFVEAIRNVNCQHLVIQIGRGRQPVNLPRLCEENGIHCTIYQFKPNLTEDMSSASLIISHCGAGSIIEAMSLRKPLIVVVNSTLQGNHQTELSEALASDGYCISTTPDSLVGDIKRIATSSFSSPKPFCKTFPQPDLDVFPAFVDEIFDFKSD